jgi:uncharacterized protein (TIGR02145 family)
MGLFDFLKPNKIAAAVEYLDLGWIDKYDSEAYQGVQIGTQLWTTRNLNVSKYRNGDKIPQVKDLEKWETLTKGAWCYYNNDPKNGAIYGKLYNWYAVNDPRGLAPDGYHIPTIAEWTTLINFLGGKRFAGYKVREKGIRQWKEPDSLATNESGFTGLPSGDLSYTRICSIGSRTTGHYKFKGIGDCGYWWSSSEKNSYSAWYQELYYRNINALTSKHFQKPDIKLEFSETFTHNNKAYGISVRCIRD